MPSLDVSALRRFHAVQFLCDCEGAVKDKSWGRMIRPAHMFTLWPLSCMVPAEAMAGQHLNLKSFAPWLEDHGQPELKVGG